MSHRKPMYKIRHKMNFMCHMLISLWTRQITFFVVGTMLVGESVTFRKI